MKFFKSIVSSFILLFICSSSLIAEDYYWVKGPGSWSELNHWATGSGGSVYHSKVPGYNDNVIFDNNSFTEANNDVVIDIESAICANLDFSALTKSMSLKGSSELHIHGNLLIHALVIFEFDGTITFEAEDKIYTLNTLDKLFPSNMVFAGEDSHWTVTGALNCNKSLTINSTTSTISLASINTAGSMVIRSYNSTVNISGNSIIQKDFLLNGRMSSANITANMQVGDYFSVSAESGNFTMDGDLTVSNELVVSYGNFTINNHVVNAGSCYFYLQSSSDISNSTFNIGQLFEINGTTVTIASTNTSVYLTNKDAELRSSIAVGLATVQFSSNGTMNCSNSTIQNLIFLADGIISGSQNTFTQTTFSKNGHFYGNHTYNNLTLTAGYEYLFQSGAIQTITGTLNASGNCNAWIILKSDNIDLQAEISKSTGTVNLDYLVVQDMNFTGGAVFQSSHYVNLQNTTGLTGTIAGSRTLHWVGGAGNWSDPNHWSLTSGGTGGQCIPSPVDDVIFDASSFALSNEQVNVDVEQAFCRDFDWRTVTNNPVLTNPNTTKSLNIFGSLWFGPAMSNLFSAEMRFRSESPSKQITSAGNSFLNSIYFEGENGEWTLVDELNVSNNVIYLNKGTLISAGNKISAKDFMANATITYDRAFNFTNSEIYLSGDWNVKSEKLSISAANSHIYFEKPDAVMSGGSNFTYYNISYTSTASTSAQISGSSLTINQLHFYSKGNVLISNSNVQSLQFDGDGTLSGADNLFENALFNSDGLFSVNNTFGTLSLSPPNIYTFVNGQTQTINTTLDAQGNCNGSISLLSDIEGQRAFIKKLNTDVVIDYISMRDIEAIAGVNYTTNNTTDLGNNAGWTINAVIPQDYYWVGNSGHWDDPAHWSFSSGGPGGEAGACLPTQNDNVIFDQASFSMNGQVVSINSDVVNCKNMDWSAIDDQVMFRNLVNSELNIHGSLWLSANLSWNYLGVINFKGTNNNYTVDLAGKSILYHVYFDGKAANWQFTSDFSTNGTIYLQQGTIDAGNRNINASGFSSITGYSSHLSSNNANLLFLRNWATGQNFFFDGTNTKITISGDFATFSNSSDRQISFDKIEMTGLKTELLADSSHINKLSIYQGVAEGVNSTIDSLFFESDAEIDGTISVLYGKFKSKATISQNHEFGKMDFLGPSTINRDNIFEIGNFYHDATIKGNNEFDTLVFSPDHYYLLGNYRTQTINKYLSLKGNNCFKIDIRAINVGASANFSVSGGTVEGYALNIRGIMATGGAGFYAAGPSSDLGDNTGWIFGAPSGYIYGFPADSIYLDGETVSIGTGTFNTNQNTTFIWSNGNTNPTFETTTPVNTSVSVVYYSEPKQCSFTDDINIHFANIKQPTCRNSTDGQIAIKSDANAAYTYLWSNGSTNASINNLTAGEYTVTVTESTSGDKAQRTFTIADPDSLKALFKEIKQPTCNGINNASLSLGISGGNHPYKITWNDDSNNADSTRNALKPGVYDVLIVDSAACQNVNLSAEIKYPDNLSLNIVKVHGISCTGMNDAKLSYQASGGTLPYSFNWSTGSTADTIAGLSTGQYTIELTDANNCSTLHDNIVISGYDGLKSTFTQKNQLCAGTKSGQIEVFVTGGNKPYLYTWDHTDTSIAKLDSLLAGNYHVSITDTFRCETIEQDIEITAGKEIILEDIVKKEPLCFGENNGEITIQASGGYGNLQYAIDNNGFQTSTGFMNLHSANYLITVQDDSLCREQIEVNLTEPELLETDYSVTEPRCLKSKNGSIELFTNGGTPPYTLQLITEDNHVLSETVNLGTGRYILKLSDQNNCSITDTLELTAPECEQALIIPNAFSPNGDATNDYFVVESLYPIVNYTIVIKSRWGKEVYKSGNINESWDGRSDGVECTPGVYYYVIQYIDEGTVETRKGFIHLFK